MSMTHGITGEVFFHTYIYVFLKCSAICIYHICIYHMYYIVMRKKWYKNESTNYYIIYSVRGERGNITKIQCLLPKDDTIVFYKIKETEYNTFLKNTQINILNSTILIIHPSLYPKVSPLGVKLVSSPKTDYNHMNIQ